MHQIIGQMVGVYAIWWREVKRSLRDRGQIIGGVSRPLLWVLVLGIGFNPYFRGEVYGEVRFVVPYTYLQFIFPAVVVLNILYTSVQSAVSLIWDREFGFLRELMVSPMERNLVLLGKILGGATTAVVHGLMVLMIARFVGVVMPWQTIMQAIALMFVLSCGLTAFGIVIASHLRGFESFGVFSNAVILPLYFTASSIFPLDPALTRAQTLVNYPEWLVYVVEWNPMTYAIDAMRGILIGYNQFDPVLNVQVVAGMVVVLMALAVWEFRKA